MLQITCPSCTKEITIDTTMLPSKPVVLPCPKCSEKLLFHRDYPNETRISRSSESPAMDIREMRHRQEILQGKQTTPSSDGVDGQTQPAVVQLLLDIRQQNAKNGEILSNLLSELRSIRFIMENYKASEHR